MTHEPSTSSATPSYNTRQSVKRSDSGPSELSARSDMKDEEGELDDDASGFPSLADLPENATSEELYAALTSQALNADGTPKRPMNAFMIWGRRRRPQLSDLHPTLRTGDISKLMSDEWAVMDKDTKQFYQDAARRLKDAFNARWPTYVYKRRPNNSRKKRKKSDAVGEMGADADRANKRPRETPEERADDMDDDTIGSYADSPPPTAASNHSSVATSSPELRTAHPSDFIAYDGTSAKTWPWARSSERRGSDGEPITTSSLSLSNPRPYAEPSRTLPALTSTRLAVPTGASDYTFRSSADSSDPLIYRSADTSELLNFPSDRPNVLGRSFQDPSQSQHWAFPTFNGLNANTYGLPDLPLPQQTRNSWSSLSSFPSSSSSRLPASGPHNSSPSITDPRPSAASPPATTLSGLGSSDYPFPTLSTPFHPTPPKSSVVAGPSEEQDEAQQQAYFARAYGFATSGQSGSQQTSYQHNSGVQFGLMGQQQSEQQQFGTGTSYTPFNLRNSSGSGPYHIDTRGTFPWPAPAERPR